MPRTIHPLPRCTKPFQGKVGCENLHTIASTNSNTIAAAGGEHNQQYTLRAQFTKENLLGNFRLEEKAILDKTLGPMCAKKCMKKCMHSCTTFRVLRLRRNTHGQEHAILSAYFPVLAWQATCNSMQTCNCLQTCNSMQVLTATFP